MGYKHSAIKAACLAGVCGLIVLTACSNGRPDSDKKKDSATSTAAAANPAPKDTVVAPPAVSREPIDTAAYNKKLLFLAHNDAASRFLIYKDYPLPGAILPFKRIVAYYGNLYSRNMGILGEYPPDIMLPNLKATCKEWAE